MLGSFPSHTCIVATPNNRYDMFLGDPSNYTQVSNTRLLHSCCLMRNPCCPGAGAAWLHAAVMCLCFLDPMCSMLLSPSMGWLAHGGAPENGLCSGTATSMRLQQLKHD